LFPFRLSPSLSILLLYFFSIQSLNLSVSIDVLHNEPSRDNDRVKGEEKGGGKKKRMGEKREGMGEGRKR
jgi:hypothetical protein